VAHDYQPVQWELFVIRLARETGRHGWHGQIVHLPDRQTRHFTSWTDARRFINQFLPEESALAPPAVGEDDLPF